MLYIITWIVLMCPHDAFRSLSQCPRPRRTMCVEHRLREERLSTVQYTIYNILHFADDIHARRTCAGSRVRLCGHTFSLIYLKNIHCVLGTTLTFRIFSQSRDTWPLSGSRIRDRILLVSTRGIFSESPRREIRRFPVFLAFREAGGGQH